VRITPNTTTVKELLETLGNEAHEICLESHPSKVNGYYTRDLLTPYEDLRFGFQ
jgi:hypothetical protein